MQAIQIQDTRFFMSQLLTADTFYGFHVSEAALTTFASFHIDGALQRGFFDSEEAGGMDPAPDRIPDGEELISWKMLQPHLYELIRGKVPPLSLKLILRLSGQETVRLLSHAAANLRPEDVAGLYLNIQYDRKSVLCTTGTSLKVFSLDKTPEHLWDEWAAELLRRNRIPFVLL